MERILQCLNIQKDPEEMSDEEPRSRRAASPAGPDAAELACAMQAKLAELEGKAAKWQAEAQRIAKLTDPSGLRMPR